MKTCKCGCGYPVFSNGYSKGCQYKRTDEKYLRKKKEQRDKKYAFPKQIKRTGRTFEYDSQIAMFNDIWEERPHVCQFTGENLDKYYGTSFWFSCFAHIINKKQYPLFKLNPMNICMVSPDFHRIVDQGTFDERKRHPEWKWDIWDSLVEKMKTEYVQFKKDNLLA